MLGLLATACFGGADIYDLTALSDAKVSLAADGQKVLSFNVRQDSLYACPGVRRVKKGDGDYFSVVRCRSGEACAVDFPATAAAAGETHTVTLPADSAAVIYLSGKSGAEAVRNESR